MLLKWTIASAFHRTRFPEDGLIRMHARLNWMTWRERRKYQKEMTSYLRQNGTLIYNRLLTAAILLGAIGFIVFGYLADSKRTKPKRERADFVSQVVRSQLSARHSGECGLAT
jgi:hypothetical protein